MVIEIENGYVKYIIDSNGRNLRFKDKQTGKDYCVQDPRTSFARIKKGGLYYDASSVSYTDEGKNRTKVFEVQFGESRVSAIIEATTQDRYFILEVISVSDEQVEELVFADIPLTLQGIPEEPFAGCVLALNLRTNVPEIPGPNSRLRAACYPIFGFAGAKAALIGCPQNELRAVMQEVIRDAGDLPRSPIGGPWALDAPINQGSYLFNFGGVTEETVADWIRLAKSLGFNQLDFHGGRSFRFGDCRPDPEMYPRGFDSLKAVIDKLHAADIAAGLHTYAFFFDKRCPWVTPVPDPRLGKDATFTLAEAMGPEDDTVKVVESTKDMSTIVGFFERNSVTLQIENELITYSGISKEKPYAFTGCERGANGTRIRAHSKGAKVHHLKECFGLFTPDGDSTLLAEVAAKSAEAFNECGFDMIYLDALDGEDILGGRENGWHYGSKFVFELWERLNKPALMEMSTFHHHLWFVRSRMGAWDHPVRSYKKFIDLHCEANEDCRRMLLPGHLGWWAAKTWSGHQGEPMFPDDIEYLCCKCIGNDAGFSLMGIEPESVQKIPAFPRLAAIIRRYENLRLSGSVPESVKAKLRFPGDEFTLITGPGGQDQFLPIQYAKHKIEGMDSRSNTWKTYNRFGNQSVSLRIEALMGVGPYDTQDNVTLADFTDIAEFDDKEAASGVLAELQPSSAKVKSGAVSGFLTASNSLTSRECTWAKIGKKFSPPLDLRVPEQSEAGQKIPPGEAYTLGAMTSCRELQGLGLWVYGDGKGEVLNFQVRSPEHVNRAIGDHYVIIDFTGWRYFELIEPEGERYKNYLWPYPNGHGVYSIYRECVKYDRVESLSLWVNNLPENDTVTCYLSPIQALPIVSISLSNPTVTINNSRIVFPTEIESDCYLEFRSMSDCKLYDPRGKLIREIVPQGNVPVLEPGENKVEFTCGVQKGTNARAHVTVISRGNPLPAN